MTMYSEYKRLCAVAAEKAEKLNALEAKHAEVQKEAERHRALGAKGSGALDRRHHRLEGHELANEANQIDSQINEAKKAFDAAEEQRARAEKAEAAAPSGAEMLRRAETRAAQQDAAELGQLALAAACEAVQQHRAKKAEVEAAFAVPTTTTTTTTSTPVRGSVSAVLAAIHAAKEAKVAAQAKAYAEAEASGDQLVRSMAELRSRVNKLAAIFSNTELRLTGEQLRVLAEPDSFTLHDFVEKLRVDGADPVLVAKELINKSSFGLRGGTAAITPEYLKANLHQVRLALETLRAIEDGAKSASRSVKMRRFTVAAYNKRRELIGEDVWDVINVLRSPVIDFCMSKLGRIPFIELDVHVIEDKNAPAKSDELAARASWYMWHGLRDSNGTGYIAVMNGTNMPRSGRCYAFERDVIASPFWNDLFQFCTGTCWTEIKASGKKMAIAKFLAYIGLMFAPSRRFEEIGDDPIDLRRVVCVPDLVRTIKVPLRMTVSPDSTNVVEDTPYTEIKLTDGMGIGIGKVTCTIREKFLKGLYLAVEKNAFYAAVDEISAPMVGKKVKVLTKTGAWRTVALKLGDIVDIDGHLWHRGQYDAIIAKSVWKGDKLYETWADYVSHATQDGAESIYLRALLTEGKEKPADLPYQQVQALWAADTAPMADYEVEYLKKYASFAYRPALMAEPERRVLEVLPNLIAHPYFEDQARTGYAKKRNEALHATIHGVARNGFLALDPIAFLQNAFGYEPDACTGVLPEGCCSIPSGKKGLVVVSRNPLTDSNCVLFNTKPQALLKLVGKHTGTIFLSANDATIERLRGDYDGDHGKWSRFAPYIKAACEHNQRTGNPLYDWTAPEADKVQLRSAAIHSYYCDPAYIAGGKLGLNMNKLNKLFNSLSPDQVAAMTQESVDDLVKLEGRLTYIVNVLVDSFKHGGTAVVDDDQVLRALSNMRNPLYQSGSSAPHDEVHQVWSNGEYIRCQVLTETPADIEETPDELLKTQRGFRVLLSNKADNSSWSWLCSGGQRKVDINTGAAAYVNRGFFDNTVDKLGSAIAVAEGKYRIGLDGVAERIADTDDDIDPEDAYIKDELIRCSVADARDAIREFALKCGKTEDEAIDAIIRYLDSAHVERMYAEAKAALAKDPEAKGGKVGAVRMRFMQFRFLFRVYGDVLYERAVSAILNRADQVSDEEIEAVYADAAIPEDEDAFSEWYADTEEDCEAWGIDTANLDEGWDIDTVDLDEGWDAESDWDMLDDGEYPVEG